MTTIAQAIANRNSVRCNIPVIGDSITEGQGATVFTDRWIQQANIAIRALYPGAGAGTGGGLGFIPIAGTGEISYTWPVSGTAANGTPEGPVRFSQYATGAGVWTFTAPNPTTSAQVMYYANGTGDQFSYQVNSGTVHTVTDSANTGDGALTPSIPMNPGDVLTVSWVSGTTFTAGIVHYASDETSGITFHGCGHYGWIAGADEATAWNQAGDDPSFPWEPSIAGLAPVALGFFLGVNDARTTGAGGGGYTAAGFGSAMQTLINDLQGYSGIGDIPLLIIIPYEADEPFTDGGGWPAYVSALQNLATLYPNSVAVNLSAVMEPVADDPGYYADDYHPNNAGHALIGGYVADAFPVPSSSGLLIARII